MAQTLASGVVIPDPGDRISAAGVQEMRTLGASVDSGLSLAQAQVAQVDAQSRARDADLADQVAGMEGMTYVGAWESGTSYRINDVVTHGGDSWARLTAGDAGEPGTSPTDWGLVARKGDGGGFGDLAETVVPGLYDTVEVSMGMAQVDGLVAALSGKRAIAPMVIGENVNLNDVTTPGEHSQQFTAWATPELNYPVGVACRVIVAANTSGSQVTQFCIPFTTSTLEIWMRNYYKSWGAWERLPMARDVAAKADANHPALYDSGWRDITSRIPAAVASGKVYLRRTGPTVWMDFNDVLTVDPPANEWHTWAGLIPTGFSVPRRFTYVPLSFTGARVGVQDPPVAEVSPDTLYNGAQALGPARLEPSGRAIIYGARSGDGLTPYIVRGLVSWPTTDAIPTTLPGSPA